ncbi:MAG: 4Fe-4S binding protein [Dehalococcoidales bacterium]|nr:4Fe-4S binding protein [Dehalococcoidales bacterium]
MPKAVINPEACTPEKCAAGRCQARKVCPTKAIYQVEPFEVPATDAGRCHGCSKCVADCPAKAISLC